MRFRHLNEACIGLDITEEEEEEFKRLQAQAAEEERINRCVANVTRDGRLKVVLTMHTLPEYWTPHAIKIPLQQSQIHQDITNTLLS